jgi:hypothetical protein
MSRRTAIKEEWESGRQVDEQDGGRGGQGADAGDAGGRPERVVQKIGEIGEIGGLGEGRTALWRRKTARSLWSELSEYKYVTKRI